MPGRKRRRLTEDLPTLAQPSLIPRIDDKDDGVTLVIVFFPDLTDIALTAQVEKVQGGRREGDLSNCEAAKERIPFGLASSLIESARAIWAYTKQWRRLEMLTVLAYGRTDLVSWHSGDGIVQRLDLFEHGLVRWNRGSTYQLGKSFPL
jgi:hypothetical protein